MLRSSALPTLVPTSGMQASGVLAFSNGEVVGVASLHRSSAASTVAEAALLIEDAYLGLGLGPILLERLELTARHLGILRLEAEVLASNRHIEWLARMDHATSHRTGSTRRIVLGLRSRGQPHPQRHARELIRVAVAAAKSMGRRSQPSQADVARGLGIRAAATV